MFSTASSGFILSGATKVTARSFVPDGAVYGRGKTDSHLSHCVNHVDIPGGITKAGYFSQSKLAQNQWGDGVMGGGIGG